MSCGSNCFSAFILDPLFEKCLPHPENPGCLFPLWNMLVHGLSAFIGGESCPGGFPLSVFLPVGFNKLSVADPDYIAGLL